MSIRLCRSLLYCPASNARALVKAATLPADGILIDLEDAVRPDEKASARLRAVEAVMSRGFGPRIVGVRINALGSQWGRDDLAAVAAAEPDVIVLPKIIAAADLAAASSALDQAGASERIRLWAMVETVEALSSVATWAAASPRLGALVMGTNDLAHQLRLPARADRVGLLPHLATCVLAARQTRLEIFDGVYNRLDDPDGFRAECQQAQNFGFDGKTLVHPGQIALCNTIFSPDPEDVAWAEAVTAAFADPVNRDKGAIRVQGRMVEAMHAAAADHLLAVAHEIERRNKDDRADVELRL